MPRSSTDSLPGADYESYREAAASILADQNGAQAVNTFGLHDVFDVPIAERDLSPAFAFLEAQGYAGVGTPALGMLGALDLGGADLLLAAPFGPLAAIPGLYKGARIVVERPQAGFIVVDEPVVLDRGRSHADDYLSVIDPSTARGDVVVAGDQGDDSREVALARVRIGAAAELLGLCDRLVDDAVTYVRGRRQFGQALADFQAVQHLLAWAATERHQLSCLFDIAVRQSRHSAPDPLLAETLKALAGRVMYAVAQTAIQVTGAISFTWEYSLNRLHHRGLGLDQLAGSAAELTKAIGARVRTEQSLPSLLELADVAS